MCLHGPVRKMVPVGRYLRSPAKEGVPIHRDLRTTEQEEARIDQTTRWIPEDADGTINPFADPFDNLLPMPGGRERLPRRLRYLIYQHLLHLVHHPIVNLPPCPSRP